MRPGLLLFFCALAATGCEDTRRDGDAGPAFGGSLTFDAAMLAWTDTGPSPRPGFDAGPSVGFDAGRDSGTVARQCTGVARSCSLYSATLCSTQMGCRRDGDCDGLSRSCYSMYSSYTCIRQDGCFWSSYSDDCSGSARSCSLYSGRTSCTGQEGCRWDESCAGSPTPCSLLSEATCDLQDGCYLR
ncbi:MAG: hypothetical protein AB8I08_39600 [Sandaracinaceae bacterium]